MQILDNDIINKVFDEADLVKPTTNGGFGITEIDLNQLMSLETNVNDLSNPVINAENTLRTDLIKLKNEAKEIR